MPVKKATPKKTVAELQAARLPILERREKNRNKLKMMSQNVEEQCNKQLQTLNIAIQEG